MTLCPRSRAALLVLAAVAAIVGSGAGPAPMPASLPAPGTPTPAPMSAAPGSNQAPIPIPDAEEVSVRLVMVSASVEDRQGRVVKGLKADDFKLLDERVPQKIEYFSVEGDEPVSIAFLLDVSGSMRQLGKLEAAKDAIRYFVLNLRPQDRFALVCFADEQVAWVTDFTADRDTFLERLNVQEGYGQTALRDAVAATPRLVDERTPGRKAIVLLTDGVDNASHLSLNEAVQLARRVEVPIYTVGFRTLSELDPPRGKGLEGEAVLRRFSDETGGALFSVHDPDDLKEAIVRINVELRYQYLIGYQPTLREWDGRYRNIRLETKNNRFSVRSRKGYYATP